MYLSGVELAIAMGIVFLGGFVQGTVGFGLNLVIVPVIAQLELRAIPGAVLLLSLPMTISMAVHERATIDWPGVRHLTVGRIPGTLAGMALLGVLDGDARLVVVGIAVLAATLATILAPTFRPGRRALVPSGFATGVTGTVAGIDGPPMALVYQHQAPEIVRPTLATMFVIGGVASALAAARAGDLEGWHLRLTLALMPAMLVGQFAARRVRHRLPAEQFRAALLVTAALAAVAAIARGLG